MRAEQKALAHLQKAVAYLELEFGVKRPLELNSEPPLNPLKKSPIYGVDMEISKIPEADGFVSKRPKQLPLDKQACFLTKDNIQIRTSSIQNRFAGAGVFYTGDKPIPKNTLLCKYGGHNRCVYDALERANITDTGQNCEYLAGPGRDARDPDGGLLFKSESGGKWHNVIKMEPELRKWTKHDWEQLPKDAYGVEWIKGSYKNIDGTECRNTTNFARFINHAGGKWLNAQMVTEGNKPAYGIFSKEWIYPGDEIFYNYGASYWSCRGLPPKDLDLPDPKLALGPELPNETNLPGGERRVLLRRT